MKRSFLLCLAAFCLPFSAFAEDEGKIAVETTFEVTGEDETTTETLYYTLVTDDENNVTATVTSPAEGANAYSGVICIPATISYNDNTYNVTAIESGAFSGCDGLTKLTIGENIASMGAGAVENCSGLTELTYEAVNCTDVGDSDSPSIANCANLVTLNIGENVTWFAENVFYGCTAVKTLNYNAITIETDEYAKQTYAHDGVFRDCISIETINIGEAVEEMNEFLFAGCTALKTVNFNAKNCTTAGEIYYHEAIFYGCYNLEQLNIGSEVTTIPSYLCYGADEESQGFPNLTSVVIPEGVTYVGGDSFNGCTGLTEVTIPSTVTNLRDNAFQDCTSLATVNYDAVSGYTAEQYRYDSPFAGCTAFKTLNIGKDVTTLAMQLFENCTSIETINYDAVACTYAGESGQLCVFYNCPGVTTINILEDVTYIPAFLFQDCIGVKTVNFNAKACTKVATTTFNSSSGTKTYTNYTPFYDCSDIETVTIGSEVTIIPAYLFYGSITASTHMSYGGSGVDYFPKFTTLVVPGNVNEIGDYAFAYCQSLGLESESDSVKLESGIDTIGNRVFYDCTSLKEIVVPNSVTSMGTYVFSNCTSLVSATLSENVNSVPDGTFYYCTSLPTITIPEIVVSIGSSAFYYCSKLGPSLTFPKNVTSIGSSAFYQCSSLESVTLDDALLTIGSIAFEYCTSLAEVEFRDKLTTIGADAFGYCSALKSIEIPNSTEDVGGYAFEYCTALEKASIGEGVTRLQNHVFYNCTQLDSVAYNAIQNDYSYNANSFPFYGCKNIRKFSIGEKVEKIPDYLLYGLNCDSLKLLTEITIPKLVTYLGNYAFYILNGLKTLHYNAKNSATTTNNMPVFIGCINLETVVFGDSVESIPMWLLMGNSNDRFPYLTELTIPENVTNVGYEAIFYCDSLKTLTYNAINCGTCMTPSSSVCPMFMSCSGLKRLNVGAKVESIPALAFNSCTTLEEVYSYNPTPPVCVGNVSPGPSFPATTAFLSSCWLIDPEDSNAAYYKSTMWEEFVHSREMTVSITPNAYNKDTGKYYATRFSPYSYTLEPGLLGGIVTGLNDTDDGGKSVHIEWIYDGSDEAANVIPAGTPIMVRSDSETEYVNETIATEDEEVEADEDVDESDDDEAANNDEGDETGEDETTMPGNWLRGNTLDGKEYYNYYATEDATTLTERVFRTYVTDYTDEGLAADVDNYYFYKFTFGNVDTEYADVLGFYWADAGTQTYEGKDGAQFEMSTGKHAWLAIPQSLFDYGYIDGSRLTLGDFDDDAATGSEGTVTENGGDLETGDAENEATGISSLSADDGGNAIIYNMAGQRVNDMSRAGIYIVNGRKVVKK